MTLPPMKTSSHSHNLSINSVASISEPVTPPAIPKLHLWDSTKLNGNFSLPTFSLDVSGVSGDLQSGSASTSRLDMASYSPPEIVNKDLVRASLSAVSEKAPITHEAGPTASIFTPGKIDKELLASLAKTPLEDLRGDILRLAKDQQGCRFLQKRLDKNIVSSGLTRQTNFDIIFSEVHDLLYELIIDPFGNYLIQKLTDYCNESNLNMCLEALSANLFLLSINQHGTRALQKIIDKMNNDYQLGLLVDGLKPYIIDLIKDLNGNHVIQKVLNKYSSENCQFIYDAIMNDLLVVATHKHGCCVLQRCLNHVNPQQHASFAKVILNYPNFYRLVNDQYGNYVLQYLISADSIGVDVKISENLLRFGLNEACSLKFSSNVVEKLLKSCYNNEQKLTAFLNLKFEIMAHLLSSNINKLINDPYGNYVVQTLLDTAVHPNGAYLVELADGELVLLPTLAALIDEPVVTTGDAIKVAIIRRWFQNCRIVSSYGKRIQQKINNVLHGATRSYPKRHVLMGQHHPQYKGMEYHDAYHRKSAHTHHTPNEMQVAADELAGLYLGANQQRPRHINWQRNTVVDYHPQNTLAWDMRNMAHLNRNDNQVQFYNQVANRHPQDIMQYSKVMQGQTYDHRPESYQAFAWQG